ncbi:uncharacterized protein M6B38_251665 [Iris pallida]|uniref:Uncharacterized protein n=1 Tax=Iris pallida TaxID=29817 RepID=A0AAX6IIQ8_IRIPA|nr:uncharacterized protein M6B38_251665 [Iris pallida]
MKRQQKRDRDAYGGGNSQFGSAKRSNAPGKTTAQQHQPQPRFEQQQYQPPARAPTFQQNQQRQPAGPCTYSKKPGHAWEVCRKRLGVCLFCGSSAHQLRECTLVPPRSAQGTAPALGAPTRPAIPQQQRGPLPTQQQRFVQHQQQGRAYAMAVEETLASSDVIAGDELEDFCTTYYEHTADPDFGAQDELEAAFAELPATDGF